MAKHKLEMKVRRSFSNSAFSSWSYCLVQKERLDSKFCFCVTLSVLVHMIVYEEIFDSIYVVFRNMWFFALNNFRLITPAS
jgi:hypothetical protein